MVDGGVVVAVEAVEDAVVENVLARVVGLGPAVGALGGRPVPAAVVFVPDQKAALAYTIFSLFKNRKALQSDYKCACIF